MAVVDAHQHFWDPQRVHYSWLAPYYPELDRRYGFEDLKPHLDANGVNATVLVQSADDRLDNESMFEIAAAHSEIAGIVAWVPLDDPEGAGEALTRLEATGHLVGVRTLVHNQPDPDWVLQASVREGLALLEQAGLPFDFVAVLPRHLELVPVLCDRHPALRIVIDHLAKPPVGESDLDSWTTLMASAAASPNVYAKVSGLYPAAGDREPWSVDDLRPVFDRALALFGPDRLMFGSDWPICEVAGGYGAVVGSLFQLFDELDPPARSALRGGTATRCYGLDPVR